MFSSIAKVLRVWIVKMKHIKWPNNCTGRSLIPPFIQVYMFSRFSTALCTYFTYSVFQSKCPYSVEWFHGLALKLAGFSLSISSVITSVQPQNLSISSVITSVHYRFSIHQLACPSIQSKIFINQF